MINTEKVETGKQLSFFDLFTEKQWRIEIPIIQRDFAQGRPKNKDLREIFLRTIYSSLENKESLDLDFVYGNLKGHDNSVFVPLDGQQRLTTLFLLHWYLAHLGNEYDVFYKTLSSNNKSRFSYQLRSSSEEFCDFLINRDPEVLSLKDLLEPDKGKNNALSKTLINAPHFMYTWELDPTVQSMLVMLDNINEIFFTKEAEQFFDTLINPEKHIITFQFFNLKDFKLSDDLYIKMNSRGVQLTPFQNFKSWLQDLVEEKELKLENINWKHRMDVEWTNLFWDNREAKSDVIDLSYYRFFKNTGLYSLILKLRDKEIDENSRNIIDSVRLDRPITFLEYEENEFFSEQSLKFIFDSLDAIEVQGIDNIQDWLTPIATKTFVNNSFSNLLLGKDNNPTRPDSVFIYALLIFITQKNERLQEESLDSFKKWMRLCRNLIYNTPIDNPQRYVAAIQSINKLTAHINSIHEFVLNNDADMLGSFSETHRVEEKIKIQLIESSKEWEDTILKLENHHYLYGELSMILEFSKSGDTYDIERFKFYGSKISKLFNKPIRDHAEKILQRALLTKGDYFPQSSRNRTYCLPTSGTLRERNDNWRKFFGSDKNIFLKQLIDEFLIEEGDIEEQLKTAIKSSTQTDWKRYFIEEPAVLNYCKQGMIRFNSFEEIYLMKTSRMYGRHAELRSYYYYNQNLIGHSDLYEPFQISYYENPMVPYHPFIRLNGFELYNYKVEVEISYDYEIDKYNLYFYEESGKRIEEIKILDILSDFIEMDWKGAGFGFVFEKHLDTSEELTVFLQDFVKRVRRIKP